MIKLLITDVDRTIVEEGSCEINSEYFEVIRQLYEQGVRVVVASGRAYSSMYTLFEPVADIIWFIADGGATIKTTDQFESVGVFPREWVEELWEDFHSIPNSEAMYCCEDIVYVPYDDSDLFCLLKDGYHTKVQGLGGWENLPQNPTPKLSLFCRNNIDHYAREVIFPKWSDKLYLAVAGDWWLDCMMPNINKGTALQIIMDKYGYEADEIIATGDNMNDMEMIQLAGKGIAVDTARQELKEIADEIIPGYQGDGVLEVWKNVLRCNQ